MSQTVEEANFLFSYRFCFLYLCCLVEMQNASRLNINYHTKW